MNMIVQTKTWHERKNMKIKKLFKNAVIIASTCAMVTGCASGAQRDITETSMESTLTEGEMAADIGSTTGTGTAAKTSTTAKTSTAAKTGTTANTSTAANTSTGNLSETKKTSQESKTVSETEKNTADTSEKKDKKTNVTTAKDNETAAKKKETAEKGQSSTADSAVKASYKAAKPASSDSENDDKFLKTVNKFACDSATKILSGKDANSCYSPASLYFPLCLTLMGADGNTKSELVKALHLEGYSDKKIKEQAQILFQNLYLNTEDEKLFLSDSLWMDDDYEFNKDYINNAVKYFYSSLFNVDFGNPETVNEMSSWIAKNTENLLKPKFNSEDFEDCAMAIVNTVYFSGAFRDPFDAEDTKKEKFTNEKGKKINVDMMEKTEDSYSYYDEDGYSATDLSFRNNGYLRLILPDKGTSVSELIKDKGLDELSGQKEAESKVNLTCKVPKFSFDDKTELVDPLKSLGVSDLFDQDNADLYGIISKKEKAKGTRLYVSRILQGTHISLDENGVKAAAYTVEAMMDATAFEEEPEHVDFVLNRPFIYEICADNGTVLFVGIYNGVSE